MKLNILLFGFVIFIISVIITLNAFFQQNYQGEMAAQFNSQQLLIAKSIAKSIEVDMRQLEAETLSIAKLLGGGRLYDQRLEEFIDTAYVAVREDMKLNVKILDRNGSLRYSSFGESLKEKDREMFRVASDMTAQTVHFVDRLSEERTIILLVPIKDGPGWSGVMIVGMNIETVNNKYLAPIRAGIRGHAWMMDGNGTLLYHPTQPNMVGKNIFQATQSCFECHESFEVEKRILKSEDVGFSSYIAPHGEDKIIAFSRAKLSDTSWIVCVSIPYSEVTFSIRKSMKLHSVLVISIFVSTLVGAFAIVVINRKRVKAEEKAKHLETQRLLEKEILQTKDYLENILESTESKIMVLDRGMKIRTLNSSQERLCMRTKGELIGKSFFDIFPVATAKDRDMFEEIFKKCLAGDSHRVSNYAYQRENKTLFINITITPLILHGEVSGMILSSSDVTEEVNLKEVLRDYAARLEDLVKERTDELNSEKEKLHRIVGTIGAGLFLVDAQKRVTWINKTLRQWLGKDEKSEITLDDICREENVQREIIENRVFQRVMQHDFRSRKGYFQFTASRLFAPDGHMQTLVLVQDVTEMKRMEEQMMHSEKLSALARISAGVAHEIGNPLTSISSYVQILREMEHDAFTKGSLDTIAKHIHRIADIVRQMSSFSKTAASDLKHHDVRELIAMTLDLVKYDKRMKNIRIAIDIPEGLPKVRVNETQCIQVFMNIVLNAADAMLNEGSLDVTAREREGEIEISFSDSGPGIPPEHLERIFDPFFTTKEKGTGLGLAVSYNIIKGYQGDIIAENRPGGGTIFRVRLPYHES